MRIFDLNALLSFAFYPDGNKKRHRNSQEYRLNIDQYSKNGSDEIDSGTIKKQLKNLKILCLGVAIGSENLQNKLASVKLRVKEKKQYKLKKEFQSPNDSNPLPLILIYKKEEGKAYLKLTDVLNPIYLKVINLFEQKNLRLKKYGSNKKAFINIENKYQNQVKQLAENIFWKIKSDRKEINIIGLFIDPYFVRKEYNDLILVDTRPADTLPRKRKHIHQEPAVIDNNINHEIVHLNTEGSIIGDPNSSDESLFLDQLFFNPFENEIKNTSKTEELNTNMLNNPELDLANKTYNSISIGNNTLKVRDNHSFVWNDESKEKIKKLLQEYQKYLQKNYFFYNPTITKHKQTATIDLLNKLDVPSARPFFWQIRQDVTAEIFNKHRNFFKFPILSYLFNTNKKTRGGILLENILSNLKEDNSTSLSS